MHGGCGLCARDGVCESGVNSGSDMRRIDMRADCLKMGARVTEDEAREDRFTRDISAGRRGLDALLRGRRAAWITVYAPVDVTIETVR